MIATFIGTTVCDRNMMTLNYLNSRFWRKTLSSTIAPPEKMPTFIPSIPAIWQIGMTEDNTAELLNFRTSETIVFYIRHYDTLTLHLLATL
ncbi:hypothetical protein M3182_13525 [Mesobacillus maritimus]|nr:hypothetical protein [Mesobacillus maritimus]MCM3586754.1 hypothetical protein [Mesobacillus maritimus]MCM3668491.1 hypothetical protein [Mesobacillus maritimus]